MEKIKSPWNELQVHNLQEYQKFQPFHPFICECGDHVLLEPTKEGWICPKCNDIRDWAWDLMLDGSMLTAFRRMLRTISASPERSFTEGNRK